MTGNEIRRMFIDFFVGKGHTHVSSSPLVPWHDPTLLFTNAGMNQFKDTFLGLETRPYTRAVSAQKCVRAGGKHNDLDAVGRTARHHTFFEMLGNFSFGDYFKQEALAYAWELVTGPRWFGLPPESLWVTVYEEDDEAAAIWAAIGVHPGRIVRMGAADNFWAMGDVGPCGPSSEIFMDMGERHRCGAEVCSIATCGCDRWREFWNCVFMQYNRDAAGTLTPLARPGVDTGLGLERLASILQGVWSNYDTDLLRDLIVFVENLSGRPYSAGADGLAHRVIADHARCCTFLIADGVRFANAGRGYVMRRILRRAVRFGRSLGFTEPFMYQVVPAVVDLMGNFYPELPRAAAEIVAEVRREEERFLATLERGMDKLEEILAGVDDTVSGQSAFLLYDTFGFPLDIVRDVAWERGLRVDTAGFEEQLAAQRQRARAARDVIYGGEKLRSFAGALQGVQPTEFAGYASLECPATVLAVLSVDGEPAEAGVGESCAVVLDQTPFYAEGGGQVGDTGLISAPGLSLHVDDTKKLPGGHYLHFATVESGFVAAGLAVAAAVDQSRRRQIIKNHTATHLLQKALREVLGEHVHQSGSLVTPERLRFDFTHEGPVSPEQLASVEERINAIIWAGTAVKTEIMPQDRAKALGAMALFGEKYGDQVRVVSVGDYSIELCGGTHVALASEIGMCKITEEAGVAAGVRRIEAVTGKGCYDYVTELERELQAAARVLKTSPAELPRRLLNTVEQVRALEKEVAGLRTRLVQNQVADLLAGAQAVAGLRLVAAEVTAASAADLRGLTDLLRDRLGSGVVVLGAATDGQVNLVAAATKDLANRVHCGRLIQAVAQLVGGTGGGRPLLAQGGGKHPEKLARAISQIPALLEAGFTDSVAE